MRLALTQIIADPSHSCMVALSKRCECHIYFKYTVSRVFSLLFANIIITITIYCTHIYSLFLLGILPSTLYYVVSLSFLLVVVLAFWRSPFSLCHTLSIFHPSSFTRFEYMSCHFTTQTIAYPSVRYRIQTNRTYVRRFLPSKNYSVENI